MSHHISNNFTSASTNNQADLTTAKADIVAIKAKTDLITISNAANISTMETATTDNATSIATLQSQLANSSSSTLKTNIDANTGNISTNASNISSLTSIAGVHTTAINANTAKTDLITVNGDDIYFGDKNIGINNTNPNCDLEIGDSGDVVRVRLNGANNLPVSSEILFTDILTGNTPEFYNGCGIRYNSDANSLQFITDNDDDNVAEIAMTIQRSNNFIGINDTSPSFQLDVTGDINTNEEFRYYGEPVPMIIAKTSLNSATVSTHRFGYGQGANNTGGSHTDNVFYMPDTNFKVAFRPTSALAYIEIDYFMDRYFSGRNLYWALGTSSAQSSIIGKTITFARGANSEWSSRKEKVRIHMSGLTPYSFYVRYIFVKEIVILSDNTVGSNSTTGWIHWGGYNSHSNGGGQTIGHYEIDTSPQTPSNSDNFGALEATVYSVPSTFTTAASTINPFQYIGY